MKRDSELQVSKRDVNGLIAKLASYFQTKKTELQKDYEEFGIDGFLDPSSISNIVYFNQCFYVGHVDHIHLDNLIKYKRFVGSNLYAEYLNGRGMNSTGKEFAMVFSLNNDRWVIWENDCYTGAGGIFVSDLVSGSGFIIEPLKHFLEARWPKDKDE